MQIDYFYGRTHPLICNHPCTNSVSNSTISITICQFKTLCTQFLLQDLQTYGFIRQINHLQLCKSHPILRALQTFPAILTRSVHTIDVSGRECTSGNPHEDERTIGRMTNCVPERVLVHGRR